MFLQPGCRRRLALPRRARRSARSLTAFCVQHDANHGAYFKQRRWNHLVGWSADSLLGFSSYAWRVKHNVAHHTYTNVDGFDDDATQAPLARFTPSQPARPWYRFQQYYIWPMYTLMGLRWQTVGDLAAFRRGRDRRERPARRRAAGISRVFAGKAFFISWAIVIPLLVYPWWAVVAAYVGFGMVTSLIMADDVPARPLRRGGIVRLGRRAPRERRIWAVHEVETTVDFCPRNPVLTWMLGGLNFQIEHHLFPRVPHTHYPKIAKIVRRNCAKHGVRYSFHPSLGGCPALALPPPPRDGPARPPGRDRDGLGATRARRARAGRRSGVALDDGADLERDEIDRPPDHRQERRVRRVAPGCDPDERPPACEERRIDDAPGAVDERLGDRRGSPSRERPGA